MRPAWIAGVLHAVIGSTTLFLCLHPLRDALAAPELRILEVGVAWQALHGLALMVIATTTRARIAAMLIAVGTALSIAMLFYITATAARPPVIVAVPIGGGVALIGWLLLLFAKPLSR